MKKCAKCKRPIVPGRNGVQRSARRAYCDSCLGITRVRGYIVTDLDRKRGYIELADHTRIELQP